MRFVSIATLLLALITYCCYAGNTDPSEMEYIRNTAPEMILEEGDFTYEEFTEAYKRLEHALDEYYKGNKDKLGWEIENIGIPNRMLIVKGYGLVSQKKIISLELENAKLKDAPKEESINLEQRLKKIEKQIEVFLSENIWVD